ncbi:MAG TPA: hypothetical protein VG013_31000 [Gemmataceae bacterium]|jgi:hypothetical protein|nr:hypothetical protein [Gemmataceae bacterium]
MLSRMPSAARAILFRAVLVPLAGLLVMSAFQGSARAWSTSDEAKHSKGQKRDQDECDRDQDESDHDSDESKNGTPELDPGSALAALLLLSGGVLVLTDRWSRRQTAALAADAGPSAPPP